MSGETEGHGGPALAEDLSAGQWEVHPYRVTRSSERPGPDWFEVERLLEMVATRRSEEREAAGWRVEGDVMVDSGAVALARAGADRRLDPARPLPARPEVYVYQTMADLNLPVETRTVDNRVVEVRVDVVDDVDEIESGSEWVHIGDLVIGEDGIVSSTLAHILFEGEVLVHSGVWLGIHSYSLGVNLPSEPSLGLLVTGSVPARRGPLGLWPS